MKHDFGVTLNGVDASLANANRILIVRGSFQDSRQISVLGQACDVSKLTIPIASPGTNFELIIAAEPPSFAAIF